MKKLIVGVLMVMLMMTSCGNREKETVLPEDLGGGYHLEIPEKHTVTKSDDTYGIRFEDNDGDIPDISISEMEKSEAEEIYPGVEGDDLYGYYKVVDIGNGKVLCIHVLKKEHLDYLKEVADD